MFITAPFSFEAKNQDMYYGRRDCFLFSLKPKEHKYLPVKDGPDLFLQTRKNLLAFGGGNGTAIALDEDFNGTSSKCDTFDNPPLSEDKQFSVSGLEAWMPY